MSKELVSQILYEMSVLLELNDENPFKVRAYENAARVVEGIVDLDELVREDKLTEIKGIGKNIAEHIKDIYKKGTFEEYEKLKKEIPDGVLEMLKIPGVGAKKVRYFFKDLQIRSLGELELLCRHDRLSSIPGFGKKTQDKILEGIQFVKKHQTEHLYAETVIQASSLLKGISRNPHVEKAAIAGSLRRRREVVHDIDILVSSEKPKSVMDTFIKLPQIEKVSAQGDTKTSVSLISGLNADLRVVDEKEYPYALLYFTGNKDHNVAMRARAQKMGLKLNEYGLFRGEKNIPCKDEEEIFKHLKLDYIPPELRENMGEIEASEKGKLPKLIEEKDIRGVLHVHSEWSDGTASIAEMTAYAAKKGYEYIGICDHSKSAAYAGGLADKDVYAQHKEIDSLNKKLKNMLVIKGIECDILADGSLDYSDKVLTSFDFVVVSVHSKFKMTKAEMTMRICKAIKNKYATILGHPTGRLLLSRHGYDIDMEEVIKTAAGEGVAIEINAQPQRLDLDWRYCHYAKEKGVKIAICTDSHMLEGIDDIILGLGIARKGWLEAKDVLNTMSVEELMKWFKS